MKREIFRILFTLVLVASSNLFTLWPMASPVQAATITSTATGGAWATGSTWVGGTVPAATDTVIIATIGTNTVTVGAAATCAGVTINNGATLTVSTTFRLTVAGSWTNNGTLITNGTGQVYLSSTGTVSGNGTNGVMSMTNGSTYTVNSTGVNFNTLYLGAYNGAATLTLGASADVNIGTLSVGSSSNTSYTGTVNMTSGATLTVGTLQIGRNPGCSGSINMTSGGTLKITGSSVTINNAGTWTPGTGTVEYSGADQTLPATFFTTYNNLTLSGSGTKTLQTGTTAINGNLTLSGTVSATTVVGLTIGGNLDVGNGTTFTVAGYNITVTGTTSVSGTLIHSSTTGTKIFIGLVTINSGGVWNNSANEAITFRGGITNNATFTAGTGVQTFDTNSQALNGTFSIPSVTVTGVTLTNNGTLTVATALIGTGGLTQGTNATLNIGGTSTITTLTATANPNTVNYYGAAQTVKATTYHHLTLSGSGTKTLGGAVTVNGDLTIGAGTTLDVSTSNYALTVKGNWINSGSFTPRNGTVTLNGTGAQTMTGATTFYNLTLNNSNGLVLNNNATINNTLTLTNGKITTGSNMVIIGTAGTVSRTNGYVIGNLRKYVATGSNVSRTFEVGTTSAYNPITVTFANVTTAGNLTATATLNDHPSIGTSWLDSIKSVNAYWTLTNSGIAFNNYNAIFTFTASDIDSGANTANFIIGNYYNSNWTYPTVGTRTSTSTQATGVTSFGDFAVAEAPTYILTVNIVGNGTVTKNPNQSTYHKNVVVQLTAIPNDLCSPFSDWSGDLVSTNNPENITMTGNKTVTATFTAIQPPDCTLTAPDEVYANSTGNTASVPNTSGATYTWTITNGTITDGQGTRSITFRAYSTSPITIGITINISGCQCTNSTPVTVSIPSALSVSIGGNLAFCDGGSTTLTANVAGGAPLYTYDWSASTAPGSYQDNEYIAIGEGTVAVTVTDSAPCSSTIVSDTNTVVTRGNGAIPHNAVLGWVHGNWWPGLDYKFGYPNNTAQWIWETYQVVHPQEGDVVYFQRSFNIPSTPIGATLRITCDNGYEAYINPSINPDYLGRAQVADYNGIRWQDSNLTDNWVYSSGWQSVETYNIPASMLVKGTNVLEVQTANEQVTGGTVTSNPGGLIYELTYEYYCTASDSVNVTVNPMPTASASSNSPVEEGSTIQLTGGPYDPSYSYYWTGPNGFSSHAQSPSISNATMAMAGDYILTVTNSYGCQNDSNVNVTVNPASIPTVTGIEIYATQDCQGTPVTSMTPQITYYAKVSVTLSNNLEHLQTVQVTLFYNETGSDDMTAPTSGDTQTCAILACAVGATPVWSISSGTPTSWTIETSECTQPPLNTTSGSWIFAFKPGRVATETTGAADWDAQGKAIRNPSQTGELYVRNKDMNWYGEITVNTTSVDWAEVPLGLTSGNTTYNPKAVSIKYIANGDYYENISSEDWAGSGETVTLSTGDPPALPGSFALKANDTSDLGTAISVTVIYNPTNDTRGLTTEDGVTVDTNSLWLSLSQTGIAPVVYSGTIYYQIAER